MGMWLNGSAIPEPDGRGRRILDDDFLIIFNAGADDATFTLCPPGRGAAPGRSRSTPEPMSSTASATGGLGPPRRWPVDRRAAQPP